MHHVCDQRNEAIKMHRDHYCVGHLAALNPSLYTNKDSTKMQFRKGASHYLALA
jgi:hypothetical protein